MNVWESAAYEIIAVCCSVLQCVAVCCSVLQCVAREYASTVSQRMSLQGTGRVVNTLQKQRR